MNLKSSPFVFESLVISKRWRKNIINISWQKQEGKITRYLSRRRGAGNGSFLVIIPFVFFSLGMSKLSSNQCFSSLHHI